MFASLYDNLMKNFLQAAIVLNVPNQFSKGQRKVPVQIKVVTVEKRDNLKSYIEDNQLWTISMLIQSLYLKMQFCYLLLGSKI